jgi:hypothetical protein
MMNERMMLLPQQASTSSNPPAIEPDKWLKQKPHVGLAARHSWPSQLIQPGGVSYTLPCYSNIMLQLLYKIDVQKH